MTGERTKEARVRGIFSSIAGRYDLFNRIASLGLDRGWRRRAIEETRLPRGGKALDICAGTGDLAIMLAERFEPAEVVAVDFTEEMMAEGRLRVAALDGEPPIKFEWADVTSLSYEDDTFDVATVAFGLRNVVNLEKALREVYRVLKPGGRFVCLEFSNPVWRPLVPFYNFYLFRIMPQVGRLITGNYGAHRYLATSIAEFPDRQTFRGMMLEAGFSRVECKALSAGMVAIHVGEK